MKILPSPDGNQPSSNPEISIDDPDELSNCIYWAKDLKEGGKMRLANWDQKINKQQRSVQDEKSTLLAAFINPKSNADAWGDLFVPTYFTMAIKSFSAIDLRRRDMNIDAILTIRFMKKYKNNKTMQVSEMPKEVFCMLIEDGITLRSNEDVNIKIGGQEDDGCEQSLVDSPSGGLSYQYLMFKKRVSFKVEPCWMN
jgi:hypothetical protein